MGVPARKRCVFGWMAILSGVALVLVFAYVLSFCLTTAYVSTTQGKLEVGFADAIYHPLWAMIDSRSFIGLLIRDHAELCLDVMMYGPGVILDHAWPLLILEALPVLAVLYVISFGPVVAMLSRRSGSIVQGAGMRWYRPLWHLCDGGDDIYNAVLLGYAEQCLRLIRR